MGPGVLDGVYPLQRQAKLLDTRGGYSTRRTSSSSRPRTGGCGTSRRHRSWETSDDHPVAVPRVDQRVVPVPDHVLGARLWRRRGCLCDQRRVDQLLQGDLLGRGPEARDVNDAANDFAPSPIASIWMWRTSARASGSPSGDQEGRRVTAVLDGEHDLQVHLHDERHVRQVDAGCLGLRVRATPPEVPRDHVGHSGAVDDLSTCPPPDFGVFHREIMDPLNNGISTHDDHRPDFMSDFIGHETRTSGA